MDFSSQSSAAYLELGCGFGCVTVFGHRNQTASFVAWPFPVMAWLFALGCFQQIGELQPHLFVHCNSAEHFHCKKQQIQ